MEEYDALGEEERGVLDRVLDAMRGRGLIEGTVSGRGRDVLAGSLAPGAEALMEATRGQRAIVERAHAVGSPGRDRCAEWVCLVFELAGFGVSHQSARGIYDSFCRFGGADPLRVGMVVAVPADPYDEAGRGFGHVGIYVGDRMVMDCAGDAVRRVPLAAWLANYGVEAEPRWGWLGGIALA